MTTLQWRPRARSVSASPPKRKPRFASAILDGTKPAEYQTGGKLSAALRTALLEARPQVDKDAEKDGDKELRVASSGVLLLGEKDKTDKGADVAKEGEGDGTVVFRGSWAVLADAGATCDDGLALKTLHEIVKGIGACIK